VKRRDARMEGKVLLDALIRSVRLTGAPVQRLNNMLHALASLPVEIETA
jgi:4-methoxybenzoate monooxygenase (O-demethylating)